MTIARARSYRGRSTWSPDEAAKAARIWRDLVIENGATIAEAHRAIAHALGRTVSSVENRRSNYGSSFVGRYADVPVRDMGSAGNGAPAHVLAQRRARAEAYDRRDLTASIFGDPPPGYSALDRRR